MSKPYNPNTQGWPFALLICAITGGLFFAAYSYHNASYRHPRDPMMQQVYAGKAPHGEGEHGEAEHGDAAHTESGAAAADSTHAEGEAGH